MNPIFLDLFGVLLGTDQSTAIHYVAQTLGHPYHQTREILTGESQMQFLRREITFGEYLEQVVQLLPEGNQLVMRQLQQLLSSQLVAELPLCGLLPVLRDQAQIWITTNTTSRHIRQLQQRHPALQQVHGIMTSEMIGTSKPDLQFFTLALEIAEARAGEVLFIDDSRRNVDAAGKIGLQTHYYTDFEIAAQHLCDLGLNPQSDPSSDSVR